jgi:high affinity Mn2+ porin
MLRYVLLFIILTSQRALAQHADSTMVSPWSAHFQVTVIDQSHSGFRTRYSGANSLADTAENGYQSVTATLFFGRRLWRGASIYFDPEMSGGAGLSYSLGVAGALNGETYRIGNPAPVVSIARVYFQQMIPLEKHNYQDVDDDVNQLGAHVPAHRIVINAGKFSMADFYDLNAYSHDPREQFMNWSLMSNGAWDYPANTRGYTWGLDAALVTPHWTLRLASVAVPVIANHSVMEYVPFKAHSEAIELTRTIHLVKNRPGSIAVLASYTASRAPSYQQGLTALQTGDTMLLNVISGNAGSSTYGGHKTGVGLNFQQQLADDLGCFARIGYNDGKYVTWAFTEIDQTISGGLSLKGNKWKRKDDEVGLAQVINGISADHRAFLKAGGYGFIIGDGNLDYGHEAITEFYYKAKVTGFFWFSFDYQLVVNPGYNRDRMGPVHVFGFRGHLEM